MAIENTTTNATIAQLISAIESVHNDSETLEKIINGPAEGTNSIVLLNNGTTQITVARAIKEIEDYGEIELERVRQEVDAAILEVQSIAASTVGDVINNASTTTLSSLDTTPYSDGDIVLLADGLYYQYNPSATEGDISAVGGGFWSEVFTKANKRWVQKEGEEFVLSEENKNFIMTGERLIVPSSYSTFNDTTIVNYDNDTQVVVDTTHKSSKSLGLLLKGRPLNIGTIGNLNHIFGDLEDMQIQDISGVFAYWDSQDYDESSESIADRISGRVLSAQPEDIDSNAVVVGPGTGLTISSLNPFGTLVGEDWFIEIRAKFNEAASQYNNGRFFWGTSNDGFALNGVNLDFRDTSNSQSRFTTSGVDFTQYNTIRLARESGDVVVYVNGVEIGRDTRSYTGFQMGQLRCAFSSTSTMVIDNLKIYNEGDEVEYNFNEGLGTTASSLDNQYSITVPNNWEFVETISATNPLLLKSLSDTAFEAVDPELFFSSGNPQALDISVLESEYHDQVIIDYVSESDYKIVVFDSEKQSFDAFFAAITGNAKKVRVPIIAFAGQSNTGGISNVDPDDIYGDILIHHTSATTNGNSGVNINTNPTHFDSISPDALGVAGFGSSFHFARELFLSEFSSDQPSSHRFATLLNAGGGQPSSQWNPTYTNSQYPTFEFGIQAKIALLNDRYPNAEFYLDTVVINQGEREVATGVNWANNWGAFMDRIRIDYGEDVNFIIELISTNGLMSYPSVADGIGDGTSDNLYLTRTRQESLLTGGSAGRPNVYASDPNQLFVDNGNSKTGLTDGGVHYSREGYRRLGIQTFGVWSTIKNI